MRRISLATPYKDEAVENVNKEDLVTFPECAIRELNADHTLLRTSCGLAGKGLFLHPSYNWEIVHKENENSMHLIAIRRTS